MLSSCKKEKIKVNLVRDGNTLLEEIMGNKSIPQMEGIYLENCTQRLTDYHKFEE